MERKNNKKNHTIINMINIKKKVIRNIRRKIIIKITIRKKKKKQKNNIKTHFQI